jgi:hypothetical protein
VERPGGLIKMERSASASRECFIEANINNCSKLLLYITTTVKYVEEVMLVVTLRVEHFRVQQSSSVCLGKTPKLGSSISNGREPRSCLGQVFNF